MHCFNLKSAPSGLKCSVQLSFGHGLLNLRNEPDRHFFFMVRLLLPLERTVEKTLGYVFLVITGPSLLSG